MSLYEAFGGKHVHGDARLDILRMEDEGWGISDEGCTGGFAD